MMSRRLILASILALPFIWVGVWAYAQWEAPQAEPPGGVLPGPVWLLPTGSAESQTGKIDVDGSVSAGSVITGYVYGLSTSGDAVFGYSTSLTKFAGIHGLGFGDPIAVDGVGSWAGYFGPSVGQTGTGNVFAERYCLPGTTTPSCITSWGAATGLWAQETTAGHTDNIYKATNTGIVAVGTDSTPSNDNGGIGYPAGTKLAIVGDVVPNGPRIYISSSTGNPEIDMQMGTAGTNNHWGIYVAKTATPTEPGKEVDQMRFWQGQDRLALNKEGVMIFYGWQAEGGTLTVNLSGTGTVTIANGSQTVTCSSSSCLYTYAIGSTLTLTATATGAAHFAGWTGACTGMTNPCTTTVAGSTSVTATFKSPDVPIVTTGDPVLGGVLSTQATLSGTVNLRGTASTSSAAVSFRYGTTNITCNNMPKSSTPNFIPNNTSDYLWADQQVSTPADIIGDGTEGPLTPDTTYYYCLVFWRQGMTPASIYGDVKSFKTAPAAAVLPTLTSLTPSSGTQGQASLSVALVGTNFTSGATCSFGTGITVNSCTYNSATSITANITISATATTGLRTATVTTAGGTTTATNNFTVNAAVLPTLTSLTPNSSYIDYESQVILNGTNFVSGAECQFGDIEVTSCTVNSAIKITAWISTYGLSIGARQVRVNTANGTSNAVTFTLYVNPS